MLNGPAGEEAGWRALLSRLARDPSQARRALRNLARRATGRPPPSPAEPPGPRTLHDAIVAVSDWHREAEHRAMAARLRASELPPAEDVTLPRSTFDALLRERDQAQSLRQLFADGPTLLIAFEAAAPYCVREASPELAPAAGRRSEALIGQPLATLFEPDSATRLLAELEAAALTDAAVTLDVALAARQGGQGGWQMRFGPPGPGGLRLARLSDLQPLRQAQAECAAQQRRARRNFERMARAERLVEQSQQLCDALHVCDEEPQAWQLIAQAAEQVFPGWSGALLVAGSHEAALRRVAAWGPSDATGFDTPVHEMVEVPAQMLCVPFEAGETGLRGALHLLHEDEPGEDERAQVRRAARAFAQGVQQQLTTLRLRLSLRDQALRDGLTGLYNRRHFDDTLEREAQRMRRAGSAMTLALLDIDHFKSFNDAFGHEAGDEVLKAVARLLDGFVRRYDTACRIGGEEMALLLPDAPLDEARLRLQQLRERIGALQVVYEGVLLPALSVSMGLADTRHGPDGDLLRRADAALYEAKHAGRNRLVVWRPGMEAGSFLGASGEASAPPLRKAA